MTVATEYLRLIVDQGRVASVACDPAPDRQWLVLSLKWTRGADHLVWYRPKANGYTSDLSQAGRYTREEAEAECRGASGDLAPVRLHDALCQSVCRVQVEASLPTIEGLVAGGKKPNPTPSGATT